MGCFLQWHNAYISQWEPNTARITVVCETHAVCGYKKLSVSSYHLTAVGVTQQPCSSMDNLRLVGTMFFLWVLLKEVSGITMFLTPNPLLCCLIHLSAYEVYVCLDICMCVSVSHSISHYSCVFTWAGDRKMLWLKSVSSRKDQRWGLRPNDQEYCRNAMSLACRWANFLKLISSPERNVLLCVCMHVL